MKCCGRDMRRVGYKVGWCGNCGAVHSSRLGRGRISPNLHVCATCIHWVPPNHGAAMTCNREPGVNSRTSSGYVCDKYESKCPATPLTETT